MEVSGIWPSEAERIENASIVDGEVDPSGNLVLTTHGGVAKNAGQVVVPLAAYPVGSIFMHTTSTNPATLLGGGTWARFGSGRVLVGVDDGDPALNSPNITGGAKTHVLTEAELPSHAHSGTTGAGGSHTHPTDVTGSHTHAHNDLSNDLSFTGVNVRNDNEVGATFTNVATNINFSDDLDTRATDSSGPHSHTALEAGSHTHAIPASGGGQAHNNMQPFVTVYMWHRTA